jgi:hypothetical protein
MSKQLESFMPAGTTELSSAPGKRIHFVLAFSVLLLPVSIFPQEQVESRFQNPTSFFYGTPNSHLYVGLQTLFGSHRNSLGLEGGALFYAPFSFIGRITGSSDLDEHIGLLTKLNLRHSEMDFGFPGPSESAEGQLKILYSLGKQNEMFRKYALIQGYGGNTLSFGLNGYLTTDTTSQFTGQIDYCHVDGKFALIVDYENDSIILLQDSYRTAAVRVSSLFDTGNHVLGFSFGFDLWAGKRDINPLEIWNGGDIRIPAEIHRGQTVTLHNGREYSADVVYISLLFDDLSLSIGYDSEYIKQLIQNNVHYLLNDGNLPILNRPDRVFIEFRIGIPDDLY